MSRCSRCLLRKIQQFTVLRNNVEINHFRNVGQLRKLSTETKDGSSLISHTKRTHHCGELRAADVGQEVVLSGWLQQSRMDGQFVMIKDAHGITQINVPSYADGDLRDVVGHIPVESVLEVTGLVGHRPAGNANQKMPTGEIEVLAKGVKLLNPCGKDLPFPIQHLVQDYQKVNEMLRMEYRYLDLRSTDMQKNLRRRSKVIMKMREYLCNLHGFVDVETPTLFRRTPGGAREFIVPTHTTGKYYCLPQSPQQFKQLLMVGAIDRYMQVARCYRDEQTKPDRQPEFTQLDIEMSFVGQDDIKELIEGLLEYVWPDDLTPLELPIPRLSYGQAIAQYGSDKPDTRFDMKLQDITPMLPTINNPDLFWLSEAVDHYPKTSVQAINFTQAAAKLSNKDIKTLNEVSRLFLRDKPDTPWYAITRVQDNGEWPGTLSDHLGFELHDLLNLQLNLQAGDLLLLAAGHHAPTCCLLGRLRVEVADLLEAKDVNVRGDPGQMNFLWVEDFPMFLPKEDGTQGVESAHHPFTAPHPDHVVLVYTNPEVARSQHYDLVLNGTEIGGGSIRIHDVALQQYILTQVLKEDTRSLSHLLEALQYGCPPHGGIALGLDRLFAIMCGSKSIRDVIAFPKSSRGEDIMAKSPATLSKDEAHFYHQRYSPDRSQDQPTNNLADDI